MLTRTLSWTLLVGSLAVVTAPRASAEPLKADPADTPLVIRGVVAPGGSTFVGNVRLTAPGKDATLRLLPSDLKLETDPTVVIDRAKVTINAGVKLAKDEPQDVRVSVGPVTRAGVYTGALRFHADGIPVAEEAVVALRLEVHPTVAVKAIPETVSVATARSGWGDALLPDRLTRESFVIVLDNPAAEGVAVKDIDVYLRGENTNHVLGPRDFTWAEVKSLPAGKATHLVLTFPRSKLSADQYKGRVRVLLDGADAPVSVPLDLSARVGPCWPIAVVLFGIIMGRIARILATPGRRCNSSYSPASFFFAPRPPGSPTRLPGRA